MIMGFYFLTDLFRTLLYLGLGLLFDRFLLVVVQFVKEGVDLVFNGMLDLFF